MLTRRKASLIFADMTSRILARFKAADAVLAAKKAR